MLQPDKKVFKEVCKKMSAGEELTFEMIGDIFGKEFWIPLVYTLMDAGDASRAIANAINRLRTERVEQLEGEDQEDERVS